MAHMIRRIRTLAVAGLVSAGVLMLYSPPGGAQGSAPRYVFDPAWPKPLPNEWKIGGVTGLAVAPDDTVWAYDRPNDLTNIELEAEMNADRLSRWNALSALVSWKLAPSSVGRCARM